jgi:hypothetical protein
VIGQLNSLRAVSRRLWLALPERRRRQRRALAVSESDPAALISTPAHRAQAVRRVVIREVSLFHRTKQWRLPSNEFNERRRLRSSRGTLALEDERERSVARPETR